MIPLVFLTLPLFHSLFTHLFFDETNMAISRFTSDLMYLSGHSKNTGVLQVRSLACDMVEYFRWCLKVIL